MGALVLGAVAPLKFGDGACEVVAQSDPLAPAVVGVAGTYCVAWQAAMNVEADRTLVSCDLMQNGKLVPGGSGVRYFPRCNETGALAARLFCEAKEGDVFTVQMAADNDATVNIVAQDLQIGRWEMGLG